MSPDEASGGDLRARLEVVAAPVVAELDAAHAAREIALAACRRVIRASGASVRAHHRGDGTAADRLRADAETALREAQGAVADHPRVAWAGFLHDAEKEYAEACLLAVLDGGDGPVPGPTDLGVDITAWLRGLAEAASELRRRLLDELRRGNVEVAENLLSTMDDVYDVLMGVDHPDALTGGLRRTVDALRAVLERSRGDLTSAIIHRR